MVTQCTTKERRRRDGGGNLWMAWLLVWVWGISYHAVAAPTQTKQSKPHIKPEALFLEVSIQPESIHVQSQVFYTVQFFRSVEITGASLTEPQTSASDAVIEKLGDDKNLETKRDGTSYLVVERRYAIFPQRSGRLTILPVHLKARVGTRSRPLNNFFDDPLGKGEAFVERHSPAVELVVEPIPKTFRNLAWLPARRIQVSETWSKNPPRLQVGEAVTRTLTLTAEGLTAAQLPEVGFGTKKGRATQQGGPKRAVSTVPSALKRYPDPPILTNQREPTGITGIREEKWVIIPSSPGTFTLPATEIPWWNVDTHTAEVAYLPGRAIIVTEPVAPDSTPASTQLSATEQAALLSANQTTAPLRHTKTTKETCQDENGKGCEASLWEKLTDGHTLTTSYWPILTFVCAFGWASTLLVWWFHRRSTRPKPPPASSMLHRWFVFFGIKEEHDKAHTHHHQTRSDKLAKQLKKACLHNDPETCRSMLLAWAQAHWPEKAIHNLNDLQYLLTAQHEEACARFFSSSRQKSRGQQAHAPSHETAPILAQHRGIATLAQEIVRLNRALFSPAAGPWFGKTLWESVQTVCNIPEEMTQETGMLPPLYS